MDARGGAHEAVWSVNKNAACGLALCSRSAKPQAAVLDRVVRLPLHDFEDRLGLDDHLVLIEEVEALDEQFVAAALDVQNAEAGARVLRRGGLGGHELALRGIGL